MPATDSKLTSMEAHDTVEDGSRGSTNISSLAALTSHFFQTTTRPKFTSETVVENKAVSMASTDCISALSSPAEASPAKPAVTPTAFEGTVVTGPAAAHKPSASDSLTCTGTTLVNISESLPTCMSASTAFGSPDLENDFPAVLIFKGVTVILENNSVWKQFYSCGTEMILTKQGRRMFPYCRYRLDGLDPEQLYSLVLSIVPSDKCRYRWSASKWEVTGPAEHQAQGLIRAFSHHYSPCKGSEWMGGLVSFYKLKLTNNSQDQEGHIILHSMHRYIPRLHVIPVPDGVVDTSGQPVVMGPESMTFTFPQTEFMAVTTYQNFRITQLKINHNPFAKGFRDDGNNSRLNRLTTDAQELVNIGTQSTVLKTNEVAESKEGDVDVSTKNHTVSASPSTVQETRLVLKPIMSFSASKDEPYVPCIRGKHALGELVLVQKRKLVETKEKIDSAGVTPEWQQDIKVAPKAISMTPTSAVSTPRSSPGYRNFRRRRRRRRINRRWTNSRGRQWKAAAASPSVVHSPSLTVAMQPELDDVEGLLFVSFTTKEALERHIRDIPANKSSVSPVSPTTPAQLKETVKVIQETEEEKVPRLEANLLQDFRLLKHRQVIHPVLQEVGLKLSSLDPTKPIDLQYLGVHLPLPPPNLPVQDNVTALSPGNEGLPFISRTGKTNDITKIKGWKNKFIRSKATSPNSDGLQKNLSAFCSNMLDEYLESEAQQISERAAAFSTNPEGSVAYQLPAKSSSYVKTLDSVLKRRKSISKFPLGTNKPCPLSHKPLLYSALTSPPPPLASPVTPVQAEAQSTQQSPSSCMQPGAEKAATESDYASCVSQKSTYHTGISQKPKLTFGQNHGMTHRPSGFTKFQFKLLQMEIGAMSQGLNRTQLTLDRLSMALSVILTKQTLPSQILKVAQYPKYKAVGPDCDQEFCRLGCVCSSLKHLNRGSVHCRRPECMFGCGCFKRKITKQMSVGESEHQIQPVYSMANMEHVVQPRQGFRANKLWNRNIRDVDPEPLFIPRSSLLCQGSSVSKALKRSSIPHQMHMIREEDKDPVYKYLESMMTCARVREFNSKPPPILTIEPKTADTTVNVTKVQKTTTDNLPKQYYRTVTAVKKSADNTSQESTNGETEARKQIQIQSACDWSKDRKMVLDALCRRVNRNKLSQRFYVGTYSIRPVAKIFIQKPSGSVVTYRIHISKQSNASDSDSDEIEFDDSDEEKHTNESFDRNLDSEEEYDETEEEELQLGVTPFLSGVLPAGRLRARTKPSGRQAYGLIQVNGKSYNQARLLLGNMGSLHPANRLAAYITGRLHAPGKSFHKGSPKSDPTQKNNILGTLHIKAAGTVVPPIITARKTTDLKTPTQPPVQLFQLDSGRKGSVALPQQSQNVTTNNPGQSFASSQRSSVSSFQSSATSSPVSLTVSPSLKTPSFLGQSGTYSFRICPPANQSSREQNLSGVTLPGGFTLIQLPKPGADGAAKQSKSITMTNVSGMDEAVPQKDALSNFSQSATADSDANGLGLNTPHEAKDLSNSKPGKPRSFFELACNEKMPSDESDESHSRQVESNLDAASEDLSSNSSDYCGEGDEDDEMVDIETVEEVNQGIAIAKMKEAVTKTLQESRYSSDDFGSAMEPDLQDQIDNEHDQGNIKRKNHVVLERQRRSEQRTLFDKLQVVLQSDPRAPRLRLLSLAVKEIRNLVETSKYLEEQKKQLTQTQSVFMKQLSLLSGKSEKLIKCKLREINERQKTKEKTMKWKPYFSHLLQSRAALLQAISPQENKQTPPLLQPDIFTAPPQTVPNTTEAVNSIHQMMPLLQPNLYRAPAQSSAHRHQATPHSVPKASAARFTVEVAVDPSQAENQSGEQVASFPVSQHQSKFTDQPEAPRAPAQGTTSNTQLQELTIPATLQITAAPDSASSKSNPHNPPPCPAQPFTLPLIRSKTGRIILPSSLKPVGKGYYTLVVMKSKENGEEGEVSTSANEQPSNVDQEKSSSASDKPSDSESSRILGEDNTTSSNLDSKSSEVSADIVISNKSVSAAPLALQDSDNSQGRGTVTGLNKPLPVCLSFNRVQETAATVDAKSNTNSPVTHRRRGRPRKHPIRPVSNSEKRVVVVETQKSVSESQTPVPVEPVPAEETKSEINTLEVTQTTAEDTTVEISEEADFHVQVKRGRGRPPKSKLCSPSAAGSSSSKSEDCPHRPSCNFNNPNTIPKASPAATKRLGDITALRPLTRGALGKDFPSAKKRSWIDIEKELDPDLEFE